MTTPFIPSNSVSNVWVIPARVYGVPYQQNILQKNPFDNLLYDVNLFEVLNFGPITSSASITVDQGSVYFGAETATATNCSIAVTTGILTCTQASGTIAAGQILNGAGVPAGTVIGTNISGVGTTGVSTWNTNIVTAVPTFNGVMSGAPSPAINTSPNIYPNGTIIPPGFIVQFPVNGGIIPPGLNQITSTITLQVVTATEQLEVNVALILNATL